MVIMSIFHNCAGHFAAVPSHTRIALNKSGAADADYKIPTIWQSWKGKAKQ
jgi:hypothetical protein